MESAAEIDAHYARLMEKEARAAAAAKKETDAALWAQFAAAATKPLENIPGAGAAHAARQADALLLEYDKRFGGGDG